MRPQTRLRLPVYRLTCDGAPCEDLATVDDAIHTAEWMAGRSIDWSCDPDQPTRIWADSGGRRYEISLIPWVERPALSTVPLFSSDLIYYQHDTTS
jgi:hypothetical protein